MLEPTASPRPSVVALAASGLILALSGCDRPSPPETAAPEPAVAPPTVVMAPARQIDRAELLAAVDVAASAYARGQPAGGDDTLVGRRFLIHQAFGCSAVAVQPPGLAAAGGEGRAGVAFGPERRTLQLSLAPADWTEAPLTAEGGETWETVEGFWIHRPWIRTDECPAPPASPLPVPGAASSAETVGLAAVFETDGSRLRRRNGRAYAFTVRQEGDVALAPPPAGYRLVLEGRMIAFPEGRAIRCRSGSPDQRPVCVAAVQLDRVAFELPGGGVLSEWRPN